MRKFIPLSAFAVAFALVEAAVVVYLRKLYYPDGFAFPLNPPPADALRIEAAREAATLVMLCSAGVAAGGTAWRKFCYSIYAFGLWDIFYYVWLKVLIGWPESPFTPDVLFLIPVVWWGPVLAPVVVAVSLCAAAAVIVRMEERGTVLRLKPSDVLTLLLGALAILYTFMADASVLTAGGAPGPYNWPLFIVGETAGWVAFGRLLSRSLNG